MHLTLPEIDNFAYVKSTLRMGYPSTVACLSAGINFKPFSFSSGVTNGAIVY
jgi:hypothetical protein